MVRLTNEELCGIITEAFCSLGHRATSEALSPDLPEVFKLTVDEHQILVCAKGVTKGGASRPDDELRIQQLPKFSNYCYEHRTEVYAAVQLGVYKCGNAVTMNAFLRFFPTLRKYGTAAGFIASAPMFCTSCADRYSI